MPLAGHGLRPTPLRPRAGRPQLKRDPLGCYDLQMPIPPPGDFSQRAHEVAEDLFEDIAEDLSPLARDQAQYHLDSSDVTLNYEEAVLWVKESVDAGHPNVRHFIEQLAPVVIVNLAAFQDPDSQFHP